MRWCSAPSPRLALRSALPSSAATSTTAVDAALLCDCADPPHVCDHRAAPAAAGRGVSTGVSFCSIAGVGGSAQVRGFDWGRGGGGGWGGVLPGDTVTRNGTLL
jgi:hypothetical protein